MTKSYSYAIFVKYKIDGSKNKKYISV